MTDKLNEVSLDNQWLLATAAQWHQATDSADNIEINATGLMLRKRGKGRWTSHWRSGTESPRSMEIAIDSQLDLFSHKTIEPVIVGSERPYADAGGIQHTWYGRCMIAIVDDKRWIMALRSGIGHVNWGMRDAIHLITSSDEGRTWGHLNRWFDDSSIHGVPFEDGHTHSEPGLYRMPNSELILQFWRTEFSTGTKQLRSTDQGKTWQMDIDRIQVEGVTGADGDRVLGCQDYFVDPEHPSHVYMAFEYFHYDSRAGCILARSNDNGATYQFVSWIGPLAAEKSGADSGAVFEPAIEYVGNRTIVAILRDASANRFTWQSVSTDMGATFTAPMDISKQVDGGVTNGLWQRARLYKESNPVFQYANNLDFARGEGRLWGFGLHSNGGGYTRKPVVYWSDNNGESWNGPQLLHGAMEPGTDTGYGDLKRRSDNTLVGATYYVNPDDVKRPGKQTTIQSAANAVDPTSAGLVTKRSDVEQYTFGGQRVRLRVDFAQRDGAEPETSSRGYEIYDCTNRVCVPYPTCRRWRLVVELESCHTASLPGIKRLQVTAAQE